MHNELVVHIWEKVLCCANELLSTTNTLAVRCVDPAGIYGKGFCATLAAEKYRVICVL